MDDAFMRLEAEYCPPIDSALFAAIVSDYDLNDQESLHAARGILETLKDTAAAEEATGFDASGSSAQVDQATPEDAASVPDTSVGTGRETDLTSLSNGLSDISLDGDQVAAISESELADFDQLDEKTKVAMLKDVFRSLNEFTVTHALRKHQNKWQPTFDDLLNQVFFLEEGVIDGKDKVGAKGVEAFSEENLARRGRKGKKKKGSPVLGQRRTSSLPSPELDTRPTANKWQAASNDIEFIASRTGLSIKMVSSIYYKHGASPSKTIEALLKDFLEKSGNTAYENAIIQSNAVDLAHDFPTINHAHLTALIGLTHPSVPSAHDLATKLTTPTIPTSHTTPEILPTYAPLILSTDDDDLPTHSTTPSTPPLSLQTATTLASAYTSLRATALLQARSSYRKSRSNALHSGAAAYYSSVSRSHLSTSQLYVSAAADALVAAQSSAQCIDLHGVSAEDAVRIARREVRDWWEGLGEGRVNGRVGAAERERGLRIVTGVGRHSKGGRGVLGPAVRKALEGEGWRVEVGGGGGGEVVVRGRGRIG